MGNGRRAGFAAARKAAGFTQERLADEVGVQRETVVRWEEGRHAPSPYLRPKLARLLGHTLRELDGLINPQLDVLSPGVVTAGVASACDWLDDHAGWPTGTAQHRLVSQLASPEVTKVRSRDSIRGTVGRSQISEALVSYYVDQPPWYEARYGDVRTTLPIVANRDWINLSFPLTRDTDQFSLINSAADHHIQLDGTAASNALQRLLDAVVLDVTIVNSPLYRLIDLSIGSQCITASLSIVPFVQYALTTDLLETELVDFLARSPGHTRLSLPMRDRYLPTISGVFDVAGRACSGGVLALCAIARPADHHRGPADYVLLTQERGQQVVNGVGRLSVIPRGFHQPLTDFRADASIGATLRRELEEELFRRADVDTTISGGRFADPMHPNRLSEPMRWLMQDPSRARFECTGFGFNLVNGNFEYVCLIVIDDPEFWIRYGDQIEANWESVGLRQYSSKDPDGIRDLIEDEAWSGEGLFALLQGLRRLQQVGDERIALAPIDVGIPLAR